MRRGGDCRCLDRRRDVASISLSSELAGCGGVLFAESCEDGRAGDDRYRLGPLPLPTSTTHFHYNEAAAQSFDIQTIIEHEQNPRTIDLTADGSLHGSRHSHLARGLSRSAAFKVDPVNNPAFANIPDGINDLSVEVEGLDGALARGGIPPHALTFGPFRCSFTSRAVRPRTATTGSWSRPRIGRCCGALLPQSEHHRAP